MFAPAFLTTPAIGVHPLRRLDGARAGDHRQVAAADLHLLAPLPTSTIVGLGCASRLASLYGRHHGHHLGDAGDGRQRRRLQLRLVADDADDRAVRAAADRGLKPQLLDLLGHVLDLLFGDRLFEDDDHVQSRPNSRRISQV